METFNDAALSPEQIKMLTLQFMGQHLTGDLKELDRNLVTKSNTLQGMVLNPSAVLNSIPATAPVQQPQVPPPQLTMQQPAPTLPPQVSPASNEIVVAPVPIQQPVSLDQNQLEFNFETSPLSVRIFDALERLEKRLSSIEEILLSIADNKKKD